MLRCILLAGVVLAGCAAPSPPPVQTAGARIGSDPALLQAFFGAGEQRGVSPVIRCGVRCQSR